MTTRTQTLSRDAIVVDRDDYARRRAAERERIIPLRAARRVRLGDQLALEFENAETLQYQVQEMVYAEGLTDEGEIGEELAAYSRMLPNSHELSATLFIELDDLATVRDELGRLTGVQHRLSIRVGDDVVAGYELPGPDEDGPSEQTYSVHFVRFRFTDEQRDAFRDPDVPATLEVDHPEYSEATPITGETRLLLLADLALT